MARFHAYKFRTIVEYETFLNGGIFGSDVSKPVPGIVGKTLIFTSPSAVTVTFAAASSPLEGGALMFKDIHTQIQTAIATVRAMSINGRLALVEVTPSAGVALNTTGTAKPLLGFPGDKVVTGKVYVPWATGVATPALVGFTVGEDNMYVATTWE